MTTKKTLHLDEQHIDKDALEIVEKLQRSGFTTFFVGGCVRDLLVGIIPKDFDIATLAKPQQVKRLIPRAYVIGKRFRLVLVKRGEIQYEVATFRKQVSPEEITDEDGAVSDNIFGMPQEDAQRRDFTINGLFYDPVKKTLIDYTQGLEDIEKRMIRMIGDPKERLEEDPIRILRALRLAHKIGFVLEKSLREAMLEQAETLKLTVLPRRREEFLKWMHLDHPDLIFTEAFDLGILKYSLPQLHKVFENPDKKDIFLHTTHHLSLNNPEPKNALFLFGIIVYSLLKTQLPANTDPLKAIKKAIQSEFLSEFMREGLGMFKFEQQSILRSIQFLSMINRWDDFSKRSSAQQFNVVKQDGFTLSLFFAENDFITHPADLEKWTRLFEFYLPKLEEMKRKSKSKKQAQKRRKWIKQRHQRDPSAPNDQN